jgi:Winged helix-turn-helix DNA-binding
MSTWKDTAIAKSVVISDAWEVVKAYSGRAAEWILFGCMVANIIEILPGVHFWEVAQNIIIGTQVIALDMGGFGLSSLARHARARGDMAASEQAGNMSNALIGLMIITVSLVTIKLLFPATTPYVDMIDKALILARVALTVLYGHVIHNLRGDETTQQPPQQPTVDTLYDELLRRITPSLDAIRHDTHVDMTNLREALAASFQATLHEALTTRVTTPPEGANPPSNPPSIEGNASSDATPEETNPPSNPPSEENQGEDNDMRQISTKERILSYATNNPDATQQQIAEACHVSLRTVQRHLSSLPRETQKLKLVK